MKIQHLAIIFVIIILPISMVITYYIQKQIDTIGLQTDYNMKLQTATADAIKGFQLNTINNKYSTVSDSKIRDIEASISTFYNSLGTELGASGYTAEDLKSYIPAIVYTMYDGYYIYGKYWNETIEDSYKYQYGLRPYIYYSCRYKTVNSDFVVNYTLDNTITVYGIVNGEYVTKSGSLILPELINENSIQTIQYDYTDNVGNQHHCEYVVSIQYDNLVIEPEILKEQLVTINEDGTIDRQEYEYVTFNNRKVYKDNNGYFWNNKNKKQYISDIETIQFVNHMNNNGHLYSNSAAQYYADAYEFSTWVNSALKNITQADAYEADGITKITNFAINTQDDKIFDLSDKNKNNPLVEGSIFNQNRISVIRKSIESNLAVAIANFGSVAEYEFVMPIFTEEDWDKLVNDVSVAAFMQGIPIGAKYYNNYCIITNDKNKEVVTADSIYIITDSNANNNYDIDSSDEAHIATCKKTIDEKTKVIAAYQNIDFELQTVVITEGEERYFYPHANEKCYHCLVSVSETYDINDLIAGTIKTYDPNTDTYVVDNQATNSIASTNLRKIYLTALAREKYDLYKTNAYFGT